jgi:hypothetical protein
MNAGRIPLISNQALPQQGRETYSSVASGRSPIFQVALLVLFVVLVPGLQAQVTYDLWVSPDLPAGVPGLEFRHTFPDYFSGMYQFTSEDLVLDPVQSKYGVPTMMSDSTAWLSISPGSPIDLISMPNFLLYGPLTGSSRPAYYGNFAAASGLSLPHASDGSVWTTGIYSLVSDYDETPAYYDGHVTVMLTASSIPEPSTVGLSIAALAGLLAVRWKSRPRSWAS